MLAEQLLDRRDGGAGALDQRMAVLGVVDRGRQHVGELHRAVVAQQQHPGVERAGHAGGEQPGAGHKIEAEALEMRDGRGGRRRPLPADDLGLALAHVVQDHRHVAAGPVEMRLHDLQREGGRDRRVEGVAAPLQDAMPTAVAIQWVEVTTPNVPSISGRVVNGLGLMFFMRMRPAAATAELTSFRQPSQSRFRQHRHGRDAGMATGADTGHGGSGGLVTCRSGPSVVGPGRSNQGR